MSNRDSHKKEESAKMNNSLKIHHVVVLRSFLVLVTIRRKLLVQYQTRCFNGFILFYEVKFIFTFVLS